MTKKITNTQFTNLLHYRHSIDRYHFLRKQENLILRGNCSLTSRSKGTINHVLREVMTTLTVSNDAADILHFVVYSVL